MSASTGSLKTTIILGKHPVITTSATGFYLMSKELPEPSSPLGSENLLVQMGLDSSYKKIQKRSLKQDLASFLPAVPHLPDFSNMPTTKQAGISINRSLMELVTQPPVGVKEIMPFSGAQLAALRLREGPIPANLRSIVLGRSQTSNAPQPEATNGNLEPPVKSAFGESKPPVSDTKVAFGDSKPGFGDTRPLFGIGSGPFASASPAPAPTSASVSASASSMSMAVSLPLGSASLRQDTFGAGSGSSSSSTARRPDTYGRPTHEDSKATKRKRAPHASDDDDPPTMKSAQASAADEKRRKKEKASTPYSQHSKDKDKDKQSRRLNDDFRLFS